MFLYSCKKTMEYDGYLSDLCGKQTMSRSNPLIFIMITLLIRDPPEDEWSLPAHIKLSLGHGLCWCAPVVQNCSCTYDNGIKTAEFVQWVRNNQTLFRTGRVIVENQWLNVTDQSKRENTDFSISKTGHIDRLRYTFVNSRKEAWLMYWSKLLK